MFLKLTRIAFLMCMSNLLMGQNPIDSVAVLKIGGIKQVITLKGKDTSKPLLLFLHGGPGNSVMSYAEIFTGKLEEHFIVVQWDQREVGKTLAANKSPRPLTVRQFEDDTSQLIDTLLKRFDRSKLYLAGHSWGTYLGFHIALNYPDVLYAYMAICPMINQLESEQIVLDLMKAKAAGTQNKVAMHELGLVRIPFQNADQLYFHRKWVLNFMGSKAKITKSKVREWSLKWLPIFNEASKQNLFANASELKCPVYFFVGRNDYQTNSMITQRYFDALKAPSKELYWFQRSAHALPTTEPDKLQSIIIEHVAQN
jgi:pimeloyl-ACP methyl ester carboxylesterase